MEYFSNDHEDCPNKHKNSHAMKRGIPLWFWQEVNENWNHKMIGIFQLREIHCRTNTSVKRKKQIQKNRTVRFTVRDPNRKVNSLTKVYSVWDLLLGKERTPSTIYKLSTKWYTSPIYTYSSFTQARTSTYI